jgi:hypothetical protein
MTSVLQNLKNVQNILKNLHKEKNVKTKNVRFIKKKFNIFCQEEEKTILLVMNCHKIGV